MHRLEKRKTNQDHLLELQGRCCQKIRQQRKKVRSYEITRKTMGQMRQIMEIRIKGKIPLQRCQDHQKISQIRTTMLNLQKRCQPVPQMPMGRCHERSQSRQKIQQKSIEMLCLEKGKNDQDRLLEKSHPCRQKIQERRKNLCHL